jgi:hypothetical protein
MQMLIRAFSTVALFGGALNLFADPMSQKDREHLIAHLEMTQSWMMSEVASLSNAQLNFRPAPDRWTIAEVVQHLAIAETKYWKLLNDRLKQPPKKLPKQASDADVLWYGIDRTRHDKTSADENPKGQEINTDQALRAFLAMHARLLEMARIDD